MTGRRFQAVNVSGAALAATARITGQAADGMARAAVRSIAVPSAVIPAHPAVLPGG